jgi:hypothetical protein
MVAEKLANFSMAKTAHALLAKSFYTIKLLANSNYGTTSC